MILISLAVVTAVLSGGNALPTPNSRDGGSIGELPENWDQTKDDTQSLFLNKSDKNDLEPYPLALSEEVVFAGNSEGYDQPVDQPFDSPQSNGELDNLIMRPELYGEPPAMEALSSGYVSRRRKRGSTKIGGAGAATKVATKGGKKNLKSEEHDLSPSDAVSHDQDAHRRKRGTGTKVGGAAASAKTATKNSGNKKNFRPISERRKRDSGLSGADVRALLNLWEAQERRKQEWNANHQWAADRYYGRVNPEEEQAEVDENGEIWYNEPVVIAPRERDFPHHSYFSEQNRMTPLQMNHPYPDMYPVGSNPNELAQRYEEARRKRQYANKMKKFMVARKRSDGMMNQANYRPRDDLYTLAELLRSAPRVQEQDIPVYRRLIL